MQRTAKFKSPRVGFAAGQILCVLVSAGLAGCGGASGDAATTTAPVSAPDPGAGSPGGATNSPVLISGTPATQAQSGQAYAFMPVASYPEGAKPTFSVQNPPAWTTFSTTSGQLSGTPSSAQTGTYANIVISVSDGATSASLAPFTIVVSAAPAASGSAVLSWNPPVTNTDGSALVNLAGYKIDYGTTAGSLTHTVTISDPTATSYMVQGLGSGTWYFAVSDFTSSGTVSTLSTVVSKAIQ